MKSAIVAILIFWCTGLYCQDTQAAQSFTIKASVNRNEDGTLVITAKSPRPLWQTIESVRERYGWTVDYEDPLYPPQLLTVDSAHRRLLRGGTFVSHIHEPVSNSPNEERRVLQEIIDQYNTQSTIKYRILKLSAFRFDISPTTQSALDQPVKIDDEDRSLRAEVDAVMAALTKTTGIAAVQGGLMNNMMEQTHISLNHSNAVPVRQLLNEILNQAPEQMAWVFTYEPNGGYFGVGFQTTKKLVADQNGAMSVKTFANPYFRPGQDQ